MQTDDIYTGTKDYFRGFARGNERGLAALLEVTDWQRIARLEIERRSTSVIEALTAPTLQAIAAGTLDLRALLGEVAQDLSGHEQCALQSERGGGCRCVAHRLEARCTLGDTAPPRLPAVTGVPVALLRAAELHLDKTHDGCSR